MTRSNGAALAARPSRVPSGARGGGNPGWLAVLLLLPAAPLAGQAVQTAEPDAARRPAAQTARTAPGRPADEATVLSLDSEGFPELRLLAVSPASESAVVADGDGTLRIAHSGKTLEGTTLRVVAILPDRLEVEQTLAGDPGATPVKRRLWVHRAEGAGTSRVQVLEPAEPAPERTGAPLPPGARELLTESQVPPAATVSGSARSDSPDPSEAPPDSEDAAEPPPPPSSGGHR